MSFAEIRLEMGFDYGASGGPEYRTSIIELASGHERRNIDWEASRGRWDLGERIIDQDEKEFLLKFHRARNGRAIGFRFKDWSDWEGLDEVLTTTGASNYQLIKTYADIAGSYVRSIQKPVTDTVTLKRNGSPYAGFTLNSTTGILTLTADSSVNISGISKANPGVVTTATAHNLTTGVTVFLSGIGGMTQLNNRAFVVTVLTSTTFSLNGENTSGYTTYTSGGTVRTYVQPSESLSWSGQFDTPVRFESDRFRVQFEAYREFDKKALYQLFSLPVVEIRV